MKSGTGLLALAALGVFALASRSSAKSPSSGSSGLTHDECVRKWADHLARKVDMETDPQAVAGFAAIAADSGWEPVRACLDARAAELAAGAVARSCYGVLYPALVHEFSGITDREVALAIAEQAERDGLRDVEACFIAYAHSLPDEPHVYQQGRDYD